MILVIAPGSVNKREVELKWKEVERESGKSFLQSNPHENSHELPMEEEDEMRRSTKWMKVNHSSIPATSLLNVELRTQQGSSYKVKLTGLLSGAFEEALSIDDSYEDDTDDDVLEDEDGLPRVLLTRSEKLKIRAP